MACPLLCILLANNYSRHSAFSALQCVTNVVILWHKQVEMMDDVQEFKIHSISETSFWAHLYNFNCYTSKCQTLT